MPEPPTPGVNGQVVGSPALQASMSMLSLEPAASTSSWLASIASAGSFCLFCENGLDGLPTETSRSPGAATAPGTDSASAAPTAPSSQRFLLMSTPLPTDDVASATYPLRAQVQTGSRRQGAGAGQWRASPVAPRRAQSCAAELSSPRSALWFGHDARARATLRRDRRPCYSLSSSNGSYCGGASPRRSTSSVWSPPSSTVQRMS